MLYEKKDYLEVCSKYDENSIEIKLGNKRYRISYPRIFGNLSMRRSRRR